MDQSTRQTADENVFYRLHESEIKNPMRAVENFFEYGDSLKSIKQDLWQILIGFMSSDYSEGLDKSDRNHYMYLFERIETLIEAGYVLNQKKKKK